MTNGDRIRRMTDEELAETLDEALILIKCEDCEEPRNESGSCSGSCRNEYLRWLKKEVVE